MNMFKSIWMLISGMSKAMDSLNAKLDLVLKNQVTLGAAAQGLADAIIQLSKNQAVLLDQQKASHALLLKIQAELTPPAAVALEITTAGATQGENGMLKVKDDGSVVFSLKAVDAKGNEGASLDAAPSWKSSDESLCKLNVAEDGMSAVGVLSGSLGTFSVHVDALSAGAALSADSEQVEVDPGAAALLQVSVAAAAAPSA